MCEGPTIPDGFYICFLFSSRIRLDWQSLVKEMDVDIGPSVDKTTTPMEFHRVALTVAYTLSNPCKCFCYFYFYYFY